jgi:hypothetical protein
MTDTQTHTGGNGKAPTSSSKRKIASASVSGSVVELRFSPAFKDVHISLDTDKVPKDCRAALTAQGAISVIQSAYGNSDNPVQAAQDAVAKLLAGDWRPGPPRGMPVVDPLIQAITDHLNHNLPDGKSVDMAHVENEFLPAYQAKHGLGNVAAARRKLRTHPDIASRVAAIEAARAKAAAEKVKGGAHEALNLL